MLKRAFLVLFLVFISFSFAKEVEVKELCDAEIDKDKPNLEVVKKQCLLKAKKLEKNGDYSRASWYYLQSGNFKNAIKVRKDIEIYAYITLFYAYIMEGELEKAKRTYAQICYKYTPEDFKSFYIILKKIFPKNKNLENSKSIWKKNCTLRKVSNKSIKSCEREYKKKKPNIHNLKRYCSKAIDFALNNQDPTKAAYYSLLIEELNKSVMTPINTIELYKATSRQYAILAMWYSLRGKNKKAKEMYLKALHKSISQSMHNTIVIENTDRLIINTFKILFKIYPQRTKYLNKGIKTYKAIILNLNKLSSLSKKLQKEKSYKKQIKLLKQIEQLTIDELKIRADRVAFQEQRAILYGKNRDIKNFNIELSKIRKKYMNSIEDYYTTIIEIYSDLNQTDKVKDTYKNYIKVLKNKKNKNNHDYKQIAENYMQIRKYYNAIKYYNKALDEIKKDYKYEDGFEPITGICNDIAKAYIKLHKFHMIPKCYLQNKPYIIKENKTYKENGEETELSNIFHECNTIKGLYSKYWCFLNELKVVEQVLPNAKRLMISYYITLGDITNNYYEDGQRALYFFNKAIELTKELYGDNDRLLVLLYHRIGTVYQGKYTK